MISLLFAPTVTNVSGSHNMPVIVFAITPGERLLHWWSFESGQIQRTFQIGCSKNPPDRSNYDSSLEKKLWTFYHHFALSSSCWATGSHWKGGLFFKANVVIESQGWDLSKLKFHKAHSYRDSAIFFFE